MDIFKLDDALISRYSKFARSFSEIRAPEIKNQVEEIYKENRFWPDPLITINPRYKSGKTVGELAKEGILDPALSQIFAFGKERTPFRLHQHQEAAITKSHLGEDFIVTTGTGSGKSLCFFVPLLDKIVKAKRAGDKPRTRAIIIYPMNALANSQLEELSKFVKDSGLDESLRPTFARYTGQESSERRREIADSKPDIILTNFMMLELLMTRQDELDRTVIGNAEGLEFLVLDELHTYRGRQGADVAMLVRRVKQRLNPRGKILCIGTSATMSSAENEIERNTAVAEVGSKLFGVKMSHNAVIGERLQRATDPTINPATLGKSLRDVVSSQLPKNISDVSLESHPLACWIETEIGLEDAEKLRRRKPMTVNDAALKLATATGLELEICELRLSQMLSLIGSPETDRGGTSEKSFLAFKLHRFISGAGRIFTTLEDKPNRKVVLDEQKWHPEDPQARLFSTYFCRECGQEVHSVYFDGDKVRSRDIDDTPIGEDNENGEAAGFLIPAVNEGFSFDGKPEDYPESWQQLTRNLEVRLKPARRRRAGEGHFFQKDGHVDSSGVSAWFFPGKFSFCPQCGYEPASQSADRNKLSSLSAEGRSSATTLIVSTILSWMDEDGSLDEHTRKILGFTDNRQDAALQAGHFNDFIFVVLLRAAIYKAAQSKEFTGGLRDIDFGDAVRQALGFSFELGDENRRSDWVLDPQMKGFQNKQDVVEVITNVLTHRLWADLKKGWRYTNPNLEDVGLLEARYPGLQELIEDDESFLGHPQLENLEKDLRQKLFLELFEYMRKGLAVSAEMLDLQKVKKVAEQSRRWLTPTWAIDQGEEDGLRNASFLMPTAPRSGDLRRRDGEAILRASDRTNLAKSIRDRGYWGNTLNREEYFSVLEKMIEVAEEHQILRRVATGFELPGWQLASSAIRLFPAQSRKDMKRANPFFRELYQQVAGSLTDQVDLPHAFEGREHTAQVDHETRAWREDRFRFGEDDQNRLEQNKTGMADKGEPKTFLPAMFCSPTMELGVDISALNAVYLRNAPPTPANYAQRAGRAGRSGQAALVVTYCASRSPHDQFYFNNRIDLVAGVVKPPALDIGNKELLTSHLQAEWMAMSRVPVGASIPENLEMTEASTETPFPISLENKTTFENFAASKQAISAMEALLRAATPYIDSSQAPWLNDVERFAAQVNDQALNNFHQSFGRWRELYIGAQREREEAFKVSNQTGISQKERKEARDRFNRADSEIGMLEKGQTGNSNDFYTYRYLATEGFLPGYNFPRLPLYAFIPSNRKHSVLQRPRFLGISEFGPYSLVYHEGRAYRVVRAKLPADGRAEDGQLTTKSIILCGHCGAAHEDVLKERCHACSESLAGCDRLDNVYRIQNVDTIPSVRITANDEDRQRQGFDIQTIFKWKMENEVPDIRQLKLNASGRPLAALDYGATATISRLNKGLRRRRNTAIKGFMIDPSNGRWLRDSNNNANETDVDPNSARNQRVVPLVEDHKNAVLFRPRRNLDVAQMAALQHAIIRGIGMVFELEEDELLGEPLPNRDTRNVILLYEATEGGAGVLNRLVSDPEKIREVARAALSLMHYKNFKVDQMPDVTNDACVSGCYRCLLSYYNQMDHDLIDRQDEDLVSFLTDLAFCELENISVNDNQGDWEAAFANWKMPKPERRQINSVDCNFVWPKHQVIAWQGPVPDEIKTFAEEMGLDVVSIPSEIPSICPAELSDYFGDSK